MKALCVRRCPDGTVRNADCEDVIARHGLADFDGLMRRGDGDVVKHAVASRKTVRLQLPGGAAVFLKRHYRAGLFASLKALVKFAPEPTALDEFRHIVAFHDCGIPTVVPVAAGKRRAGLLQSESFLVTLALDGCVKLDEHLARPMDPSERRAIIGQAARLVRAMHAAGFNHRDLYLCHLLRTGSGSLVIVDLHRVQRRRRVPERWLVKDLAALQYSAPPAVSRTDRLRFLTAYLSAARLSGPAKGMALKILKKSQKMLQHNAKKSACPAHGDL